VIGFGFPSYGLAEPDHRASGAPMSLDAIQITKRLSFVRYLYEVGVYQSRRPEPLCYSAILTLHDAVELFMDLAALHLDMTKEPRQFMGYWDIPELRGRLRVAVEAVIAALDAGSSACPPA